MRWQDEKARRQRRNKSITGLSKRCFSIHVASVEDLSGQTAGRRSGRFECVFLGRKEFEQELVIIFDQLCQKMNSAAGGAMGVADFSQALLVVWQFDITVVVAVVLVLMGMGHTVLNVLVLVAMIDTLPMNVKVLMRIDNTLPVAAVSNPSVPTDN